MEILVLIASNVRDSCAQNRIWYIPVQGMDIPLQKHRLFDKRMRTKEGCSLRPHVLSYKECIAIRARAAYKQ